MSGRVVPDGSETHTGSDYRSDASVLRCFTYKFVLEGVSSQRADPYFLPDGLYFVGYSPYFLYKKRVKYGRK